MRITQRYTRVQKERLRNPVRGAGHGGQIGGGDWSAGSCGGGARGPGRFGRRKRRAEPTKAAIAAAMSSATMMAVARGNPAEGGGGGVSVEETRMRIVSVLSAV